MRRQGRRWRFCMIASPLLAFCRRFLLRYGNKRLSLHKIICARQSASKLALLSLALSLHKIICARQLENKFSLRLLALSLHKVIPIIGSKKYL